MACGLVRLWVNPLCGFFCGVSVSFLETRLKRNTSWEPFNGGRGRGGGGGGGGGGLP